MTECGPDQYDVAIIGGGVVGSAIARELSRFELRVALVEAGPDVGGGTSKANTSILHTGFDAQPDTLEARLVRRGGQLLREYAATACIAIERTGAMLVAWNDEQVVALDGIRERAVANGYGETRRLNRVELYRSEPHLGSGALAGLEIPDESVVCTFTTPLAFATEAVANGVALLLGRAVTGLSTDESGNHLLEIEGGRYLAALWVINAAGLNADVIDSLFGHQRFTVTPRRGELIVFDKMARPLVNHILLPVPTKDGKGVLVAPTVFGNVLLGPTAEDVADRDATESTAAGIEGLRARGSRILPRLLDEEVTAIYAGLRAATEHSDYQVFADVAQRYICIGGIRSTGLTASMGIAEHIVELLAESGLRPKAKPSHVAVCMPAIGERSLRPYRDAAAIERDPAYGQIVCHCERVTRGEIRDAMRSVIPATTLDGLRRRTRATLGRCQGFYCSAEVASLLGDHDEAPLLVASR